MAELPRIESFAWRRPLSVRWGDMDSMGHVNNVKYFTYDEQVRIDYFADLMRGDDRFWKDYGLILARIEADFIAQLRCPATLDIGFRIARLGRSSLGTEALMLDEGKPVAVTRAVLVWFDYRSHKPLPISDELRARIRSREVVAPAG